MPLVYRGGSKLNHLLFSRHCVTVQAHTIAKSGLEARQGFLRCQAQISPVLTCPLRAAAGTQSEHPSNASSLYPLAAPLYTRRLLYPIYTPLDPSAGGSLVSTMKHRALLQVCQGTGHEGRHLS